MTNSYSPDPASATTLSARQVRLIAFVGIALTALNMRAAVTALPPLIGRITPDLGLDSGAVGVLVMLPTAMFAVSAFAAPQLLRRLGLPGLLIAAMVLTALGQISRVLGPSTATLFGGSLLALFAIGVTNAVAPLAVREYFPDKIRSMSMTYMLFMQAGMMLPPLLVEPVATAAGSWQLSLASWSLFAVAATLPWIPLALAARKNPLPNASISPNPDTTPTPTLIPMWRSPIGLGLFAMFGFTSFSTYCLIGFIPQIFTDAGASPEFGGMMLSYWAMLGGIIAVLGPWLVDRFRDPFGVLAIFLFLYCAGTAGMLLSPMSLPWLWVTMSGLGPIAFPMALTLVNYRARTAVGARSLSALCQGAGYTVACAGPVAFGALYGATGNWVAPLGIFIAATAVVAVGGFFATRPAMVEDTIAEWGLRGIYRRRRAARAGRVEQLDDAPDSN